MSDDMGEKLERIGGIIGRREAEREEEAARPRLSAVGDDVEEIDRQVRDAQREERSERWAAVVDDLFAPARLEDVTDDVRPAFAGWAADPSRNLVVTGPVGVGKSHAAAAATYVPWMRGVDVVAWELVILLDEINWTNPGSTGLVRRCSTADLLLLDDVGADRLTDWAQGRLTRIVADRWRRGLPTVVTTNLEPPDLLDAVGERVYSRLADDAVAVAMTGPDRRRQR